MRNGSLLHRVWSTYAEAASWATGYRGKWMWPWRWLCWRSGEHEDYYGCCVICGKALR